MAFTRVLLPAALASTMLVLGASFAEAQALRIVAIGASNTWGWGVPKGRAYPERLQAMLRARGIDAHVKNAGVNFSTTRGMLERLDRVVPASTTIVILEPGRNDLRFFSTVARRAARVRRMIERIKERGMTPLVYEPAYAPTDMQWDQIHLTAEAHEKIAVDLVPQVLAAMPKTTPAPPSGAKPAKKPAKTATQKPQKGRR